MKLHTFSSIGSGQPRACVIAVVAFVVLMSARPASAQWFTLANPDWNITLTDAGYSDFLLDNTPGFEGREYLSGEWGAAVGYQLADSSVVSPQWLEPNFVYPDWRTGSPFSVVTPLAQTGLNADSLPIAESVIASGHLQITLRHEMLDTVVGTPMGMTPASSNGVTNFINSSRYVLKQTCTIKNISGSPITNVQFFQLLHGLNSQRGVYDNRLHAGPFSEFRHDLTAAGVDPWSAGLGSSSAGLEDYIAFHSSVAPSAFEVGRYGIEGNGVDDHVFGKPSDGVHWSVEHNWQIAPFSSRAGADYFAPAERWVAGVQRWNLGNLAAGQSVSLDLLLSLRTGTKVTAGPNSSGGCNGGASVPGGVDYEFDDVATEGSCFGEYSKADAGELAVRISAGEFDDFTFLTPGLPAQIWKLQFTGAFAGMAHLHFAYDPTILPPGFAEETLCLYEFTGGTWQQLAGTVDPVLHTISVSTTNLAVFALGTEGGVPVQVAVSVAPANSGATTGAGTYMSGSGVTLVAIPAAGYVFASWTEGASAISTSPSYTFQAQADRTLVANFVPVGAAKSISTASQPSNGGSTSGDGAYALGASATVHATPSPGYKFSKWQTNGVQASTAKDYTFTVTGDQVLVAKFKPVYAVVVSAEPANGGEVEADPVYEAGELAKLKAKPAAGYCFVHWTQNGLVVSTQTNYQFNVTASRELVGHFALGHRIDARSEPLNGGTAAGGGIYSAGVGVNLVATANPGYVFYRWTEDTNVVSAVSAYGFTATASRTLVASFIAQPGVNAVQTGPETLVISWSAAAPGWVLQENSSLSPMSWTDSLRPVNVVGSQNQVTVTPLTGLGFFRLVHP
jgi:hypothetical protein